MNLPYDRELWIARAAAHLMSFGGKPAAAAHEAATLMHDDPEMRDDYANDPVGAAIEELRYWTDDEGGIE